MPHCQLVKRLLQNSFGECVEEWCCTATHWGSCASAAPAAQALTSHDATLLNHLITPHDTIHHACLVSTSVRFGTTRKFCESLCSRSHRRLEELLQLDQGKLQSRQARQAYSECPDRSTKHHPTLSHTYSFGGGIHRCTLRACELGRPPR